MTTFKSKKGLEEFTAALVALLYKWGLKKQDWLLGKYIFLYYAELFRAQEVTREATIYVNKNKLPWQVGKSGRTIVPPPGTKYFKEFDALQRKFNAGVDFYPLPDEQLALSFLKRGINKIIGGCEANIESVTTFVWQQRGIERLYAKKTIEQFRAFYFADKKRYEARDAFHKKVWQKLQRGNYSKKILADWQHIMTEYRHLMRLAYPELFVKKAAVTAGLLEGKVVYGRNKISGEAICYHPHLQSKELGKNSIIIFGHFSPVHIGFLKRAKAIVTEGGGVLSHAAVVCREAKVPCVVDVQQATRRIHDGQNITIDFDKGTIC